MKPHRIANAAACLLVALAAAAPAAPAQTRTRRSTTPQRRTAPASRLDQTRFNAQRLELATLSKDLTRFLYLYGRVSKDMELTSAQAESADAAGRAKAALVENVRAMRDRLDKLEGQFRFSKGLESQYQTLRGVSATAEQAALLVTRNQYDLAGKELLKVSEQLTDVLLEMQ